jgi:2-amino-4-hydroxy-6-hydroxymethyldihydropteridine diphosphokinase
MAARGGGVTRVFIGLGANIGNREENLRMALRLIGARCRVITVSSLYGSPALVLEGQPPGPDFVNAVCEIETEMAPEALLDFVKEIEHAIGRRPAPRWSARPIDLDILLVDSDVIDSPRLQVPHPAMHERAFVLVPLAELAPDAVHPVMKRTIGELAEDVDLTGLEHLAGPEWSRIDVGASN